MRQDLDSIGAETLTPAEAKSSIFADAYRGYVKLKQGDAATDDFPEIESDEDNPTSTRYDMTADDIASGLLLTKFFSKNILEIDLTIKQKQFQVQDTEIQNNNLLNNRKKKQKLGLLTTQQLHQC